MDLITGERHDHLPHQEFPNKPVQVLQIIGAASIYPGTNLG